MRASRLLKEEASFEVKIDRSSECSNGVPILADMPSSLSERVHKDTVVSRQALPACSSLISYVRGTYPVYRVLC